jgi:hypothetical protein
LALRIETGRDEDGKRSSSYETMRGTEDDAQRRRFELLNQHEQGTFSEPSKLTLAASSDNGLITGWRSKKSAGAPPRTTRLSSTRTLRRVIGGMKLQKVRGHDLQGLYTKLATGGRLGLSSVAHVHHILSPAFRPRARSAHYRSTQWRKLTPRSVGQAEAESHQRREACNG